MLLTAAPAALEVDQSTCRVTPSRVASLSVAVQRSWTVLPPVWSVAAAGVIASDTIAGIAGRT